MEQLGNVLAAIVVFSSLWLVRRLTKREIQNEDLLGKKNTVFNSELSMPLDDYERDLDKVFDYNKITTISLNKEETTVEALDDFNTDDFRFKDDAGEEVAGANHPSTK